MAATTGQLPLFHVVGFSGHRQVDDPVGVARAIREALAALQQEGRGEWIAISSVAAGSDVIFVREVLAAQLSWHAILPLPPAEFRTDFNPEEWRVAEGLLPESEQVRVITENGTREDAYLDCGLETVNQCDVLLAVWDGAPARGRGGTAEIVEHARTLEKPLVVIDARTLVATRYNFDRLRGEDESLANLNRLPEASDGWGHNPFNAPAEIFAFQQKCDHAASRGAPHFRRLIVFTVALHVLATLVAAGALAFDLHFVFLPWLKLACLLGALGVALVLHRHQHSLQNWVHCRLAAEFCRSALATWGLRRSTPLFEDIDLPHMRGLARTLLVMHSRATSAQPVSLATFKALYLEKRIDDQAAYYRKQEARALPMFKRLRIGFWVATVIAIACTFAYAVAHTVHAEVPEWLTQTAFYFLPISLPVIAASFISLVSINDLQRRVARYREMQLMLADTRKRLLFCETWNSVERVVLKTERAFRQEMLEWHSITSFSESH